jgi:hypothetical protein
MCVDSLKKYLEVGQSAVTILALLVGGWWTWRNFIRNRGKFPRVRLGHSIFQSLIDDRHRMIRVTLRVENQSTVLIRPGKITVRIQQVKPWPADILDESKMLEENESFYTWPLIAQRQVDSNRVEIEPNESDEYPFDFVIDAGYATLAIYSYVENLKKRRKHIGWTLTTIFDAEVGNNG